MPTFKKTCTGVTILKAIYVSCLSLLSFPCSLVITIWERADHLALLCAVCHFPIWCVRLGKVLDCIDSLFLRFSLLFTFTEHAEGVKVVTLCSKRQACSWAL